MKIFKKKKIKFTFLFFIFLIALLKFFDTPYNVYSVLNNDYDSRMEKEYGFCKNESWGFYNLVNKKFKLEGKDIKIINDEGFVTLDPLFNFKKDLKNITRYAIILNYQSENNNDIFSSKYNFLKNYKVKFRYNNCFLLELND